MKNTLITAAVATVLVATPTLTSAESPPEPGKPIEVPSLRLTRSFAHKVAQRRLSARSLILREFGRDGAAAVTVAECESTFEHPSPHTGVNAVNGQYVGIAQEGLTERRTYGWYQRGSSAATQVRTFYRHFVAAGRSWRPWQCKP